MSINMFKKFFGFIRKVIINIAAKCLTVGMAFMPKKTFIRFAHKYDFKHDLDDCDDEVILKGRAVLRIKLAIKAAVMAIGTFLGYAIYKKCHA